MLMLSPTFEGAVIAGTLGHQELWDVDLLEPFINKDIVRLYFSVFSAVLP